MLPSCHTHRACQCQAQQVSQECGNKSLKAQWKSVEKIAKLRSENCCFRCERQNCYARVCPFLPVEGTAHEKDVARPKEPLLGPNGLPLRAKWKTVEQIDKLRMECRCFRCERQGCSTTRCSLLPAINPKFKKISNIPPGYEIKNRKIIENKVNHGNRRMEHDFIIPLSSLDTTQMEETVEIEQEAKMNTDPFLVNALINDVTMIQALVDNGCLCSGIIDDTLAAELRLPRISISPRSIETAENSTIDKPIVKHITFVCLDLDGIVTPKLWLYVVPNSTHQMILGKRWLEDQDAVIHAKEQRLNLRKNGGSIYSVKRWRNQLSNIARPRIASIETIASMVKTIPICKASLDDINKALRPKSKLMMKEAQERLPNEIKDFAHIFAHDCGIEMVIDN
ncbi:hypothetical protein K3495_g12053 [Podosphaera aphanis]|nr:hypothetical protein K3495_g12053 [Podosphaera aphanis]